MMGGVDGTGPPGRDVGGCVAVHPRGALVLNRLARDAGRPIADVVADIIRRVVDGESENGETEEGSHGGSETSG